MSAPIQGPHPAFPTASACTNILLKVILGSQPECPGQEQRTRAGAEGDPGGLLQVIEVSSSD